MRATLAVLAAVAVLAAGCGGDESSGRAGCGDAKVVAFGDSITYGVGADEHEGYPDFLRRRADVRVVNAGLPGNRLLRDGGQDGEPQETGPRALARLDREVLAVPDVRDAIVLHGINDFRVTRSSADEVIAGLDAVARRLERAGVDALIGTLPPTGGHPDPGWGSAETNRRRQRVNAWIRAQRGKRGVVDFDAALRDPVDPTRLRAAYDSGDHVHPSAAGYRAMADAVPLRSVSVPDC